MMVSSVRSFPLFRAAASIPLARKASTWSRMRLISGEMTIAVPFMANAGI